MNISKLSIEGYKNFKDKVEIKFHKGLNVIVGENASGKTTIIDALRLILSESEFSYMAIRENDFHRSFDSNNFQAQKIKIDLEWEDLNESEQITFLTWHDGEEKAKLHFEVENKESRKGKYRKTIWGGASLASAFEEETFDFIECIYLPPLRDAETKLINGRGSRIAKLLKLQFENDNDKNVLVASVNKFNKQIIEQENFKRASEAINNRIKESIGEVFAQRISLQFTETSFSSILESIKLIFFPNLAETDLEKFCDIALNSLGYNNLLYIATVLAELEIVQKKEKERTASILLIEEPEAHLHPQLQIKLIKYLNERSKNEKNMQIIITTHSPILASSVEIDRLIHIVKAKNIITTTNLKDILIRPESRKFLSRWLDITKSTLFFSRGVILVEGISEALLIPELAKIVLKTRSDLPNSLEEAGIAVVNINGLSFFHFMQLFCNISKLDDSEEKYELQDGDFPTIPLRCSGITDRDSQKSDGTKSTNYSLKMIQPLEKTKNVRLFVGAEQTFEYELLKMGKNFKTMASCIAEIWPKENSTIRGIKNQCIEIGNDSECTVDNKKFLAEKISHIGKGTYAQVLAEKIIDEEIEFEIPDYIKNAIIWACGDENA